VVVLILSGTVAALTLTGTSASTAIALEPLATPGANPFMPPVGTDQPGLSPPQGSGGTSSGGTPGLYGGTLRQGSCDPRQMVAFLSAHPDKSAAWATVLGIRPADIAGYVASLAPVMLRSDVAVTNHGFTGVTTGVAYLTAMIKVVTSQTTGDYLLHFADGLITGNVFRARLFVKKDALTTNYAFGLQFGSNLNAVYTPFIDTGDHVVVVNAAKVKLTGRKEDQKIYRQHSGYEGGLREERARLVRQLVTESVIVAMAGGGCGLLLAIWATDAMKSIAGAASAPCRW
jgi:hypothetical protein